MKNKKQKLRIEADNLFKQVVLLKNNGRCEVCGSDWNTTAHHFFPRSLAGYLHYYLPNGVALCRGCHFAHHTKSDPRIHEAIIRQRGQKWFDHLKEKKEEKHFSFKTIEWYVNNIKQLQNYASDFDINR